MRSNFENWKRRAGAALAAALVLGLVAGVADAKGKLWKKKWVITITAPDAQSGYHFGAQTFTIKAENVDSPPSPLPLRMLTATADGGASVQGVWRQEGKSFSLTFELPCDPAGPCATVILRGKMRSNTTMDGQTILILDNRDRSNATGFETVNGTFEGVQQ